MKFFVFAAISSLAVTVSARHNKHTTSRSEDSSSHDFEFYPFQPIFNTYTNESLSLPTIPTAGYMLSANAMTLFECEQLCEMDPKCTAYSYNEIPDFPEFDPNYGNCRGTNDVVLQTFSFPDVYSGVFEGHHHCRRCEHTFLTYPNYNFIANVNPKAIIDLGVRTTETMCQVACDSDRQCYSYAYNFITQSCLGYRKKNVNLVPCEAVSSGRKVKICPECSDLSSDSVFSVSSSSSRHHKKSKKH